jgi:pSer/pThr/pTyr-binding forkhead associated (FHA) protein
MPPAAGRHAVLTSEGLKKLPNPDPAMWILRTVTEGHPDTTFRILPGGVRTLGRATGADFIVDAALVSRVHCRLTALADGSLEVRDLESTNGTFVNGERIGTVRLVPGDKLQVGRVELVALRDAD